MPTIQLEQYVPGQYIDKALGEVVEYHKFNKEFEEKQRQFDEKADLESERNSIMSRDITNRKEIADMSEKRQALDDSRDDYIRISSKLRPTQSAAMARQYGLDDLAEEADRLGVRVNDAEKAINAAKASGDPGVLRQVMNEHDATINEMSGWAPQYRANLELDLEGYAAQTALMSLKSTFGERQLFEWGINTRNWDAASPTQARVYLAQFPSTMELKGKREAADYNKLVKAYEIYATTQASMQELGITGEPYRVATENIAKIGKEIGLQTGLGLTSTPTTTTTTTTTKEPAVTPVTVVIDKQPVLLEPKTKYRVSYKTIAGKTVDANMKGFQINQLEDKKGYEILSREEILPKIVSRWGNPKINKGNVIKDSETGKVLTYVGTDWAPVKPMVTEKGQKIKSIKEQELITQQGTIMYFDDSSGKRVGYTIPEAMNTTFVLPSGKEAPIPLQENRIAEDDAVVVPQSGLLKAAQAEEMPSQQDSIDAQLQNQQDIEDIISGGI